MYKRQHLRPASAATRERLRALLADYLRELAATTGEPLPMDARGELSYPHFDAYWQEPERHPFGIWFGSRLAGLCLLRNLGGGRWQVAELYVVPALRRQGVGRAAVAQASGWCREQGAVEVAASVHPRNSAALAFWQSVGFTPQGVEADGRARFVQRLEDVAAG